MRLFVALLVAALASQLHAAELRKSSGALASPIELLTIEGKPISLAQLRGKGIVA